MEKFIDINTARYNSNKNKEKIEKRKETEKKYFLQWMEKKGIEKINQKITIASKNGYSYTILRFEENVYDNLGFLYVVTNPKIWFCFPNSKRFYKYTEKYLINHTNYIITKEIDSYTLKISW